MLSDMDTAQLHPIAEDKVDRGENQILGPVWASASRGCCGLSLRPVLRIPVGSRPLGLGWSLLSLLMGTRSYVLTGPQGDTEQPHPGPPHPRLSFLGRDQSQGLGCDLGSPREEAGKHEEAPPSSWAVAENNRDLGSSSPAEGHQDAELCGGPHHCLSSSLSPPSHPLHRWLGLGHQGCG